jgi:hypothetical protein
LHTLDILACRPVIEFSFEHTELEGNSSPFNRTEGNTIFVEKKVDIRVRFGCGESNPGLQHEL